MSISDDTGASAADGITADNTIVLTGTRRRRDTRVARARGPGGSLAIGSTIADGAGQWSFDYTGTALTDGSVCVPGERDERNGGGSGVSPSSPAFAVTIDTVGAGGRCP